jgi:hypothetical protein
VDNAEIRHIAVLPDGGRVDVGRGAGPEPATSAAGDLPEAGGALPTPYDLRATAVRAPLGRIAGVRSGDKGGDANIGVWARTDEQWRWLAHFLTVGTPKTLLPETADHAVTRHLLPNLRALNFVVEGLLQEGVAASTRFDPQGKALGEWLRSRVVDIAEALL